MDQTAKVFRPYEGVWSSGLIQVNRRCIVIVSCDDVHFDYDFASYLDCLEWRGLSWNCGHKDCNPIWRLHDPIAPWKVIWCETGSLYPVLPEMELYAALDPSWFIERMNLEDSSSTFDWDEQSPF
ncbi:hypothetical protein EBZ80_10515 [bacterium]|nr:hypothetical protein [bacterium]